jgi:hypothetical protein
MMPHPAVDNRVDSSETMEGQDGDHGLAWSPDRGRILGRLPDWASPTRPQPEAPRRQAGGAAAPEEVPMQWFIVEAANKPGEFARHADAIAKRGINLRNVICLGIGDRGGAAFYATDEAGLRSALNDAGIAYREVSVVTAELDDKPGTVADAARRLGDAGVNIELIAPAGMDGTKVTVAFGVDKLDAARSALGDLVSTGATAGAR